MIGIKREDANKMGIQLSDKQRVEYIRKGNELFNKKKYKEAETIFMLTNYRDGILRIADRYYYELKKPLVALKFYYKINATEKIEEIKARMLFAFKKLIREDKKETKSDNNKIEKNKENNNEPTSNIKNKSDDNNTINPDSIESPDDPVTSNANQNHEKA